jgi:hypothetical protein
MLDATPTPINELAYNLVLKFFLGAFIPRAIKGIEVSTLAILSARC